MGINRAGAHVQRRRSQRLGRTEKRILKLRITIDSRTYEVEALEETFSEQEADPLAYIQSSIMPSARLGTSSGLDENKVCRSPLAGVVTHLHISRGQHVQPREALLLLEAMKMEIKVTAQSEGIVKSIEVSPGVAVRPNQVLVVFE